jgi:hypothetical protein
MHTHASDDRNLNHHRLQVPAPPPLKRPLPTPLLPLQGPCVCRISQTCPYCIITQPRSCAPKLCLLHSQPTQFLARPRGHMVIPPPPRITPTLPALWPPQRRPHYKYRFLDGSPRPACPPPPTAYASPQTPSNRLTRPRRLPCMHPRRICLPCTPRPLRVDPPPFASQKNPRIAPLCLCSPPPPTASLPPSLRVPSSHSHAPEADLLHCWVVAGEEHLGEGAVQHGVHEEVIPAPTQTQTQHSTNFKGGLPGQHSNLRKQMLWLFRCWLLMLALI